MKLSELKVFCSNNNLGYFRKIAKLPFPWIISIQYVLLFIIPVVINKYIDGNPLSYLGTENKSGLGILDDPTFMLNFGIAYPLLIVFFISFNRKFFDITNASILEKVIDRKKFDRLNSNFISFYLSKRKYIVLTSIFFSIVIVSVHYGQLINSNLSYLHTNRLVWLDRIISRKFNWTAIYLYTSSIILLIVLIHNFFRLVLQFYLLQVIFEKCIKIQLFHEDQSFGLRRFGHLVLIISYISIIILFIAANIIFTDFYIYDIDMEKFTWRQWFVLPTIILALYTFIIPFMQIRQTIMYQKKKYLKGIKDFSLSIRPPLRYVKNVRKLFKKSKDYSVNSKYISDLIDLYKFVISTPDIPFKLSSYVLSSLISISFLAIIFDFFSEIILFDSFKLIKLYESFIIFINKNLIIYIILFIALFIIFAFINYLDQRIKDRF